MVGQEEERADQEGQAVGTKRGGDTALASKHEAVVLATTPKRAQGGPN